MNPARPDLTFFSFPHEVRQQILFEYFTLEGQESIAKFAIANGCERDCPVARLQWGKDRIPELSRRSVAKFSQVHPALKQDAGDAEKRWALSQCRYHKPMRDNHRIVYQEIIQATNSEDGRDAIEVLKPWIRENFGNGWLDLAMAWNGSQGRDGDGFYTRHMNYHTCARRPWVPTF